MHDSVPLSKRIRWRLEYWAASALFGLLGLFSIDTASAIGARMLSIVGPRLRAHKVARRNLKHIFPDKDEAAIQSILDGMWNNLGRTIGELPHLDRIAADTSRTTVDHPDRIHALHHDNKPGILFSTHSANWEVAVIMSNVRYGMPVHPMFRAPNNPLMVDLYNRLRRGSGGELLPKGRHGAKRALALLKEGGHLALLADQKMNDGIEVPLLGHPAMTAPAMASFAIKFDLPVVPVQIVRTHGAHFAMFVEDPIPLRKDLPREQAIYQMMADVNARIGQWITEHPEQWMWVHRRWKD